MIVDDGSEDGSWDIALKFVQSYQLFQAHRRPDSLPKGANSCRNFGAEKAVGKYLVFLDADDLLTKDSLSYRVDKTPLNVNLAVFKTANFSGNLDQITPFSSLTHSGQRAQEYLDLFLDYRIPWHTSSCLWEKSFFKEIGGFDTELQRFQDVDIHIRALANSKLKLWVDLSSKFTSYYRKSEFHQQITIPKRRFLLNQGFLFLDKLQENLGQSVLPKTSGLAIYLSFRFEEVMGKSEVKKLSKYYNTTISDNSKSLKSLLRLYQILDRPSKLRKGLSYLIYRFYLSRI